MRSPEHSRRDNGQMTMGNPAPDQSEELDTHRLDGERTEELDEVDEDDEGLEDDQADIDEDLDDSDLKLLITMAELDAEAAEAYRIAAEYTDQVHFRTKLEEFRSDHLRHVENLNRWLAEAGEPEVSTELDEESSAVTMLAASMGVMGVRAALLAMIGSEQLTNASYRAATELPFEEDVARVLREHFADEQRHLAWLTEQETRVRDEDRDAEADL